MTVCSSALECFISTEEHIDGSAYTKEWRDCEASVATIRQAAMLDQFLADVSTTLTDALERWLDDPAS
jgi:hypothetical protein